MLRRILLAVLLFLAPNQLVADDMNAARQGMLEAIRESVAISASYTGIEVLSERVMQALADVPRHVYVPEREKRYAYDNRPLPIGHGQTISQPLIVGLMTELLNPHAEDVVLEIGTGSGYQAAVLAQLVAQVYSIEIVPALAEQARQALRSEGVDNVKVLTGDGYAGWPEQAPFDSIIVTAAPEHIPQPLLSQLKPGGTMIIPVGPRNGFQQLQLVEKNEQGELEQRAVLPVQFVPFTREQ